MIGINYKAYRTSKPQILVLRFARYAKYIGYYTKDIYEREKGMFARYAKYIGYYTVWHLGDNYSRFARYAKYIGYYT